MRRGLRCTCGPSIPPAAGGEGELDHLAAALLQSAGRCGFEPEDVLHRLEHRISRAPMIACWWPSRNRSPRSWWLNRRACEGFSGRRLHTLQFENALVVALTGRAAAVRRELPRGVPCVVLRLRSVQGSIEGQTRPGPEAVISIVSRSAENPLRIEIDAHRSRVGPGVFVQG